MWMTEHSVTKQKDQRDRKHYTNIFMLLMDTFNLGKMWSRIQKNLNVFYWIIVSFELLAVFPCYHYFASVSQE